MDSAGNWLTSGTFWAGSGVVVALIIGAATVWATFAVSFPKRRLLYGMPVAAPLLMAPTDVQSDLELYHRGALLNTPYTVTVELISRGRRDIASTAYDGKPILLDVGVQIIEVLQTTSEPATIPLPPVNTAGTSLEIGPGKIAKRQRIALTLLTDGGQPYLTCSNTLIDVQLRDRRADESRSRNLISIMMIVLLCLATGFMGGLLAKYRVPPLTAAVFLVLLLTCMVIPTIQARMDR